MNIHDEMSDTEVLSAAADSLSAIRMAGPPGVEAIMARGRTHRRHRRSALAGLSAAAAAGTALAVGLTGMASPARAPGTIRTMSFTLVRNANGTDTLTISPQELLDPAALQSDLAKYGIPAKVTAGTVCTSAPVPGGFSQAVSTYPAGAYTSAPGGVQPTITIDPSAMPAGTELSVGDFQLGSGEYAGEQQADFLLIDTSAYTCTSTPPDPNGLPAGYGPDDAIGLLYGGPGPAGS